jgi:hypothetical protein
VTESEIIVFDGETWSTGDILLLSREDKQIRTNKTTEERIQFLILFIIISLK